ncbi:MAG: hypothetical protein ACRD0G_17265 [Acidimicrobiales bacterium]
MRSSTMYACAAIAVVTATSLGLRACGSSATGPDAEAPTVVDAPPVLLPVGPAEVVDGVPHGWRHDADGARGAAMAAVSLTGKIATAGFITRSDIIGSIATSGYGPALASLSSAQLAELSVELGDAGVSPAELVWSEIPLTARVTSVDEHRAVVEVWAVLVVGVPGVGAPRQAWRTVTVELAWERADWRIDGWDTHPGPTPALAADSVVSSVEDIAEVARWPPAGGGA